MAGIEPRRDKHWLQRKLRDHQIRIERLEAQRRVDATTGEGMGRPWLPLSVFHYPPSEEWPGTTSSSFTLLAAGAGFIQHPFTLVYFNWWIPDASTSGQFRVGVGLSVPDAPDPEPIYRTIGTFDGPNGGTGNPFVIPATVDFGALAAILVEGRRTAGTGDVRAKLGTVYGVGLEDNPYDVIE